VVADGFSGNVTFTCTGAPTGANCNVNPNPATLAGSGTVPLTVSVATAAATAQARIAPLGALLVAAPVVLALSGELPRVISAGLARR